MLSKRERIIAIAALTIIVLFGVDRWLVTPLMERRDLLLAQEAELLNEAQTADRLLREHRHAMRRWRELSRDHLAASASQAESQILHAVRNWSREARLNLTSVQPDRAVSKDALQQITLAANATGDIKAVARFLFQLEQAELPVRIERLRLSAAGEGKALNIDVRLSTVYRTPEANSAAHTGGGS